MQPAGMCGAGEHGPCGAVCCGALVPCNRSVVGDRGCDRGSALKIGPPVQVARFEEQEGSAGGCTMAILK